MPRMKQQMDEKILACVYYGPNGERLIKRGCNLARMLDCPLYILTIDPQPLDEMNAEKANYIEKWRRMAIANDADEFILKDNEDRPVYKVIAEVARQKGITQIVIGQTVQSRWEMITKESMVNCLLREIPFVDLHIISVARYLKDPVSNYDKGVRAYLVQDAENFRLVFKHSKNVVHEGIFFKECGTDFNNGVFKFLHDKEMLHVEVVEDYVKDLTDVEL